ncbi:lytic transglycosylase domain-containing protein [Faunimonas pinastri]|uniref:lytic transglycosylase domain-containing protein n=1 Tax=Faunimonas pinastri TaxID=1855383 RepID=UPI0015A69FE1|nr:lytic transglycosylase domain-containing protein [Faunimonas pinastri]
MLSLLLRSTSTVIAVSAAFLVALPLSQVSGTALAASHHAPVAKPHAAPRKVAREERKSSAKAEAKPAKTAEKPKTDESVAVALPREKPADPVAVPAVQAPRQRPEVTSAALNSPVDGAPFFGFKPDYGLRNALDEVRGGHYDKAEDISKGLPDPLAFRLVSWLVARAPDASPSLSEIEAVRASHPDWPEPNRLRVRAESAFFRTGPDDATILSRFSDAAPTTTYGTVAFIAALSHSGKTADAAARLSRFWRTADLAPDLAARVNTDLGSLLTRDDHLARFRALVMKGRGRDALIEAQALGAGYDDLARVTLAAMGGKGSENDLAPLTQQFSGEPLFVFAKARLQRRAGKLEEAANTLLNMPDGIDDIGNPSKWWDERRDLSRNLLDADLPNVAYEVAVRQKGGTDEDRADAAFHAGWYALRFMNRPDLALPNFKKLAELATSPATQSRAYYWLARTFLAEGRAVSATAAFNEAGAQGASFYGQLARERVGLRTTGLERSPEPTALDRVHFAAREDVRVIRMLASAGHVELATPFLRHLGSSLKSPGEVALAVSLSRQIGQPRDGMTLAIAAGRRGVPVGALALPFMGIPSTLTVPAGIDKAMVYAIARQESRFNPTAASGVGARGLMQLMPSTAQHIARARQMPYSLARLTSDPEYNATLGSTLLANLMDRSDQSYVLTFIGYNAGPGRAQQWVQTYGDPRDGAVDPVDWIERIPFDETRNYVMRVMENLQVYRSRLGRPLSIRQDLVRAVSVASEG